MAWTIDQLAAECARRLDGSAQPSGRVTDAPGVRTIRYYAALGLLDAPRGFESKRALYDEHHLLQLVAIKRLQRTGLALSDVQRQLAGAGLARLRSIAQLELPDVTAATPPPRTRFWTRAPRTPEPVRAYRLAPGITLLIDDAPRPFTDDDAAALRAWLEDRGLAAKEDR